MQGARPVCKVFGHTPSPCEASSHPFDRGRRPAPCTRGPRHMCCCGVRNGGRDERLCCPRAQYPSYARHVLVTDLLDNVTRFIVATREPEAAMVQKLRETSLARRGPPTGAVRAMFRLRLPQPEDADQASLKTTLCSDLAQAWTETLSRIQCEPWTLLDKVYALGDQNGVITLLWELDAMLDTPRYPQPSDEPTRRLADVLPLPDNASLTCLGVWTPA